MLESRYFLLWKFNLLWWKIGTAGQRRADFSRQDANLRRRHQDSRLVSIISVTFATIVDFSYDVPENTGVLVAD